jgi:hypothetical protein
MTCANCSNAMLVVSLEGHGGTSIAIDACTKCQLFWFDQHESLQLTPGSTLKLFALIGEHAAAAKTAFASALRCPRCAALLFATHDRQRSTPFTYWRCNRGHGRLITFVDFLREKNFIRALTAEQLKELRQNLQFVNCSNCGAPIDLSADSACAHCRSPISMLDMKQAENLVHQLRQASEPKPVNPALPMELARARREVEASFASMHTGREWWRSASSAGLVEAGLIAVARWLKKSAS